MAALARLFYASPATAVGITDCVGQAALTWLLDVKGALAPQPVLKARYIPADSCSIQLQRPYM